MKRIVSLFVMGITLSLYGQNVTENKVSFKYIQLPTNVIDKKFTTYNMVVTRPYELANEDSLAKYQAELESASIQYEAELIAWQQNVDNLKRTWLTQMADWEKKTNAGAAQSSPPVEPAYLPQPAMRQVEMPRLHSDITDIEVDNKINIAGYTKGNGGATLTIDLMPMANIKITEAKKGGGSTTKYEYTCNYTMPVGVKVEAPGQAAVLQTIVSNTSGAYKLKSFASRYEYQLWMLDNKEQFWIDLEKYARNKALTQVNTVLNDKCGFPVKTRGTEVYTVKKFKEHNYNDITTAYTVATQGYKRIAETKDRKAGAAKLNEAIGMWKKTLEESNTADKKSRVNDKVTALLYCNIAEAYIWLSDFDQAEIYINLAKNGGVMKFKNRANALQSLIKERRLRWNSYF